VLLPGVDEWLCLVHWCQGMFAAAHHMCNSVLAGGMAVEAWVDFYFIYETQVIFRLPWPAVGLGGYVSSFNAAG
jgi:hypothetical protein